MKIDNIDLLAFGPHPDDVELMSGGLLLKLAAKKYQLMIVDLTKGEAATRGTPALRDKAAKKASQLIGLKKRINLGLPDSRLFMLQNGEVQQELAKIIRHYRPKIVIAPYWEDRHPDHVCTSKLVTEAIHLAGLSAFNFKKSIGSAWRPKTTLYAPIHEFFGIAPAFFVDISDWMDAKRKLILCYESQFYDANSKEPETIISKVNFLPSLDARARMYGSLIGVKYAEMYITKKPIIINDPIAYF